MSDIHMCVHRIANFRSHLFILKFISWIIDLIREKKIRKSLFLKLLVLLEQISLESQLKVQHCWKTKFKVGAYLV